MTLESQISLTFKGFSCISLTNLKFSWPNPKFPDFSLTLNFPDFSLTSDNPDQIIAFTSAASGPPTITSRGRRIYYVSKACDTKQGCERRQAAQRTTCRRSWFNDWACTYCCYEDLCNYFVTLNGDEESVSIFIVIKYIFNKFNIITQLPMVDCQSII